MEITVKPLQVKLFRRGSTRQVDHATDNGIQRGRSKDGSANKKQKIKGVQADSGILKS